MKKKLVLVLTAVTLSMCLMTGCGASSNNVPEAPATTPEATAEAETTPESTEAPHEHTYTEEVTAEATCEADGETLYTCDCGDTYTEPIAATGHVFENYASNNDATYTADGTETATCSNCDVTDTRTAEGSKLTYTYTDTEATMYAQKTVNIRSLPNTDGEKLGSLSTNDEVKVTGQCAETGWYRIEYNGNTAYVSNNYVGTDKVVVQPEAPAPAENNAPTQSAPASSEFPYELYTVYDNGTYYYFYSVKSGIYSDAWHNAYDACTYGNGHRYYTFETWETVDPHPTGSSMNTQYKVNGETVKLQALFCSQSQLENQGRW